MEKQAIVQILEDWNFWHQNLDTGIVRPEYLNELKGLLGSGQVVVVTGARRAGKSLLMRQCAKMLIENGLHPRQTLMVNFEDPRWSSLNAELLDRIFETFLEFQHPSGAIPFLFLDEIQTVQGWEKWVRMMHELKKATIVLSGSNATLLSRELASVLTGRHVNQQVFPLSFREFLAFRGAQSTVGTTAEKTIVQRLLREFLEYGGFPEVVKREQKKEILLGYAEDIVARDLVTRYRIRKEAKLRELLRFYLSNVATLTTYTSVGKWLDISPETVEKFSGYLENVYLTFFIKRFSFKVKEQEKSPRKLYAIDTGLANAMGFSFSENRGRLAENMVAVELMRRKRGTLQEVFYWKDIQHREADFVVKDGYALSSLIQICWDMHDPRTRAREVRSLRYGMEELKMREGILLSLEEEGEERVSEGLIRYVPIWKWLLEN